MNVKVSLCTCFLVDFPVRSVRACAPSLGVFSTSVRVISMSKRLAGSVPRALEEALGLIGCLKALLN